MIGRLNTPFDHIERILLQDFSDQLLSQTNFFSEEYGNRAFLSKYRDKDTFFLDSFTYTPFIDHSQTEYAEDENPDISRTGVYSDTFLNDFNCGRYNEDYSGLGKKVQFDTNRHPISQSLFKLRNLQKDIYDAKIAFRDAIDRDNPTAKTDAKTYIYTFCEHLAELFAKLSNIRMSYVVYGFKPPHREWEGILALDIWYQMLYR